MCFADDYLQKYAIRDEFISVKPDAQLTCIVAIPAYMESGLTKCLDSLFLCTPGPVQTEIIVLINDAENSSEEVLASNLSCYQDALEWVESHQRDDIKFHIISAHNLAKKHFGAGLARKLVMDEAVRRFNAIDLPEGLILSLDADTRVESNYLQKVDHIFRRNKDIEGCSIRFEHPTEGSEFSPEIYDAIINYELHQRYYLQSVRYTTYPFAHHTVGSCFAVRAGVYCKQGGMSKRQAGEDFYFIQKVAMQGKYADCNSTVVYPSPRPSTRVPFGTGPDIARQLSDPGSPYLSFNPTLFLHIKSYFDLLPDLFASDNPEETIDPLHPHLQTYLLKNDFLNTFAEIRNNVASYINFKQRCFRKFNMLWILKYLHYAEENGVPKLEVEEAARQMLSLIGDDFPVGNKKALLERFRELEIE